MQALYLTDTLRYRDDLPMPTVNPGEALIRLSLAGICATDLELLGGYASFTGVPGHEFVGVVEAVAEERHRHWLGRRVTGSINIGCGRCRTCCEDGPKHCRSRKVLGIRGKDGAFADYFTLPVDNLFAVPANVTDASAVFTEPLAAAAHVLAQIDPAAAPKLAVVGPGRLGLLIGKVLSLAGLDLTMLGRSETSLVLPARWGLKTESVDAVADDSFDGVVDASGQSAGFAQALRIVRPRGRLILKSTFAAIEPVDLTKVVVAEIQLIGSRCGPFAEALALLAQRAVPVESMIDGRYPLWQGAAAFAHAAQAGVRKILLTR